MFKTREGPTDRISRPWGNQSPALLSGRSRCLGFLVVFRRCAGGIRRESTFIHDDGIGLSEASTLGYEVEARFLPAGIGALPDFDASGVDLLLGLAASKVGFGIDRT